MKAFLKQKISFLQNGTFLYKNANIVYNCHFLFWLQIQLQIIIGELKRMVDQGLRIILGITTLEGWGNIQEHIWRHWKPAVKQQNKLYQKDNLAFKITIWLDRAAMFPPSLQLDHLRLIPVLCGFYCISDFVT